MKLALFSSKSYEQLYFYRENKNFHFELTCFESSLKPSNVALILSLKSQNTQESSKYGTVSHLQSSFGKQSCFSLQRYSSNFVCFLDSQRILRNIIKHASCTFNEPNGAFIIFSLNLVMMYSSSFGL